MSIGQGAASRCALGVESVWGNGVAVTEIIPFDSEGIEKTIKMAESVYLDGTAGKRNAIAALIDAVGDLSGEMVWDEISGGIIGIERILRGALGSSARDAVNNLNQYLLSSTIDDSYTVAFNKQVSAWEAQGAKIGSLALSGTAGEILKFSASLIAKNMLRTGDAGIINAISGVTAISPSNNPTPMTFDNMVFRLADQVNAIASADEMSIGNFEVNLNNNLTDSTYGTIDSAHTSSNETLEPIRNGLREVTFKVQIQRYTSDQLFTWLNANTALQADFIITNGSFNFKILIPNLRVTKVSAPISGAETMVQDVEFIAIRNAGTNTFMKLTNATAITEELAIESKSNRSTAA